MSITERSQMPKLLLRAAAYYQYQSTHQNANNRTSRHSLQQGKGTGVMHLASFYTLLLWFQMQKQRTEKVNCYSIPRVRVLRTNTCLLFVSLLVVQGSLNIVTFCVIKTGIYFFPPNTFFQACVDFYRLLIVPFPSE